jgi:hypothetical protein
MKQEGRSHEVRSKKGENGCKKWSIDKNCRRWSKVDTFDEKFRNSEIIGIIITSG